MKKNNLTLIAASIASAFAFSAIANNVIDTQLEAVNSSKKQQTRYIIKFKDNSLTSTDNKSTISKHSKNRQLQQQTLKTSKLAAHGVKALVHLNRNNASAANLTKAQFKALKNDPSVDYIEVDPERFLIESLNRGFGTITPGAVTIAAETPPYGIALVQADQVSDSATSNMKVCITDTGYEGNHEDLRPYTDSGVTGDNDDGLGNNTGNWWQPGHSHGTHVAGTIAGLGNNGVGVVGVNPSGLLDLHIVKIFNNAGTWGYGSDMVKAVEQCQNSGSKVISMSIGGSGSSTTEENAFIAASNAGLLNIAAAGNDGNTSLSYPASYDSVMSVAALDSSKNLASFSQRNAQVEIAAPGVAVTSTINGNSYATWDGTSMATPHAAGVAALVWSHYPSCTGEEIRQAMNSTAEDLGSSGRDNSYGYGLVQAKAMYDAMATSGCTITPPPPPPPPEVVVLENNVAQNNLSGAKGDQLNFKMDVPTGATDVNFAMSGGSGDADLYVKFGSAPTTSSYDCRPWKNGNSESCAGTNDNGTYYVMLNGYSAFNNTSLVGSFTDVTTPPGDSYTNNDDVNIVDNSTQSSTINVTGNGDSGSITVDVDIKHTYVGDLTITLVAPNGDTSVLRQNTGGSADNIVATYTVDASGIERNGQWQLQVNDNASWDTGYIDSWTINF